MKQMTNGRLSISCQRKRVKVDRNGVDFEVPILDGEVPNEPDTSESVGDEELFLDHVAFGIARVRVVKARNDP